MNGTKMKQCKYCGQTVAKNAKTCPQCGATLKKSHGCLTSILVILGVFILIIIGMFATGKITKLSEEDRIVTVVTNSGKQVEMTRNELEEIHDSNEALFDKEYQGAKVSYEFTVSSVKTNFYFGSEAKGTCYDEIMSQSSLWNVLLLHDSITNLDEIKVGDRIYVESQLCGGADYVFSADTILIKK